MSLATIVKGNTFSLAIPLQVYAVEDGEVVLRDYTPESGDAITIRLKGDRRNYTYIPSTNGSTAFIHLEGSEVVGVYAVEVEIVKDDDSKLTSMRFEQLSIVESIDELNEGQITEGIEQGAIYLDPEIFIAGEDGRGIVSIAKTATSGLVDTYTITYTDNTTSTFNVTNGKDGINGQDGADGQDGVGIASIAKTGTQGLVDTYTITMTNGTTYTYQVTNGKDGQDGTDGVGIVSITKTSTSGLVDTYTIYYSDNTTSTFEVTNGAQGADGVGITSIEKTSTSGLVDTYTITLSNGNTSTFDVTNGKDGVDLGLATIVDNLTEGGSTNVLSAEQGKVLGERTTIRQTIQATSLCTFGAYYNYSTSALTSSANYKYTLIPIAHIVRLDVTGCYQKAVHYFAADGTTKVGRTTNVILTKDDFPSGAVYCGWSYSKNDYLNVVIDYDSAKEIADNMQGIVAEQIINVPVYRGNIDITTGEDSGTLNSNWLLTKQFIPLCGATGIYVEEANITTGGVYWYDKNKNFISYLLSCKGMLVPNNAVYCKVRLGAYTMGDTSATIHLYNAKVTENNVKDLQVGLENISPRILAGRSVAFLGDSITYAVGGYTEYFGIISGATISKYAVSGKCYAGGEIAEQAANLVGNEDLVVMMGGTNDFNQSKLIGNIYDVSNGTITPTADTTTFCGGLHKAINDIYTKCPTVQIVIITPPQKSNGWTANSASKYLYDYADAIKDVAKLYGIPVVDQFANCGINPVMSAMKSKYFNSDGTHPNNTYHLLLAEWLYNAIATWVKEPYD